MKRALLLIVAPILLAALAFAQTPASITPDQTTSIKGCLGGSEGNYTVMQDNTGHIFKIATSGVDLKPHLGHDVTLITHKATGVGPSADNSVVVTELNMISEHCAEAAGGPVATVSTPSETAITPPEAAAPAATVAEAAVTPAEAATAPAPATSPVAEAVVTPPAAVTPPAETVVIPPAVAAPPVETVVTPSESVGTPAARPRRQLAAPTAATATPGVTAKSSAEPVGTPAAATSTPLATPSAVSEPVTTPATDATSPAAPAKTRGALWLLIAFAVFLIVLGIMVPSINRWRKQKSLEQTGAPNLSFTRDARSDPDKSDVQGPRKAA
jgi:hypothetical protein